MRTKSVLMALSVALSLVFGAPLWAAEDEPVLRVAVISDVQGYPYPEDAGMRNLEVALGALAPFRPELVVTDGDINDGGCNVDAVRYYKARCDARLGSVPHVACLGNHEIGFIPEALKSVRTSARCIADFNAVFGEGPDKVVRRTVKGYDFIALSLGEIPGYTADEIAALKVALDAAVARDATKPIFVLTHYHPYGTVADSDSKRMDGGLRALLDAYPQVVSLSGHTHTPLWDPRAIWQGSFTALDTSTLCYGCIVNRPAAVNQISCLLPYGHEAVGCMLMEIYATRIVFRRFEACEGREIEPENRWTVDLPYDPSKPVYGFETRRQAEVAPQFADDPKPTIWYDYGYLYLLFEPAMVGRTNLYRIELTSESGEAKSYIHQSDYYRLPERRAKRICFRFPPKSIVGGQTYRVRIVPEGFFGAQGKAADFSFFARTPYPYRDDIINALPE